jgi:ATP-dependent Lhr-like helicase
MEEAGRIRRGYFLAGLGGSQFAHPGALDRLRALVAAEAASGDPEAHVLASTDPANPYGAALPWPRGATGRLMRAAGTHVVLVDGSLAAYLGRGQADLVTLFPAEEPTRARVAAGVARALALWAALTGRPRLEGPVDGQAPAESPLALHLAAAGYVPSGRGFRLASAEPVGRGPRQTLRPR